WLLSHALNRLGRHEQALAELDRIRTIELHSPPLAASLDNARAYTLGRLRRTDEALALLRDAEARLVGEPASARTLVACIHGTRGIALYHGARDLDEARAAL